MRRLRDHPVLANLVLAVVYALVGHATLELGEAGGVELRRVIWSSSGIAATMGILCRFPVWWGAGLGGALATLLNGSGSIMVVGTAVANGLEVGLTVALLRRFRFDARLERVRDVVLLIVLSPGVAALTGALISVSALVITGGVSPAAAPRVGVMWWLTHAIGIIAVTPMGLTFSHTLEGRPRHLTVRDRAEAVLVLACIAVTSWVPFHAPVGASLNHLFFLPLPLLQWAALRIGPFGAATGGFITTAFAIAAAVVNSGPLGGTAPTEALVLTWLFSNVAILPTLITSALVASRERSEQERQQMQARLLQGQKMESLGVLAGGIAHDFNNLLQAIRARAELIRDSPEVTPQDAQDAEGIIRTADEAAGLCRQMLTYAGRGMMLVEPLDLSASAREIRDLLRASAPRGVDLRLELPDEPLWVAGDPSQIRQVILNLVVNGADAAEAGARPGCVTVCTRRMDLTAEWLRRSVTRDRLEAGPYVVLEVSDNGIGMTDQTQQQIFDPFYSSKGSGRGLGLSTVLGVVRSHKAALVVDSQPGEGSRFQVAFPLASPPQSRLSIVRSSEPGLAGQTVLVVDDDIEVRHAVSRLLERAGLVVIEADGGDAAIDILAGPDTAVHAILMDVQMPGMSGLTLLRELRSRGIEVPVVLASGHSPEGIPVRSGADSFVQKPFRREELIQALHRALQARTPRGDGSTTGLATVVGGGPLAASGGFSVEES